MLKFLRRYQKWILGIGGSILMVLFLLPTTTSQLGQNAFSQAVAYADGDKITVIDLHEAAKEMAMIDAVSPGLMRGLGIEDKNALHWLLLVREARLAGLVGGPKESRRDVSEDVLSALRARATENEIDRALAHARGVLRLLSLSMPASVYSTREAVRFGHRLFDTATVTALTISADSVAAALPDPDEARLTEHFEKYRDSEPSADPYGIGYRRPRAAQVEWLTIDRMNVEAACTPDPIEVNKFWRQNQSKFPGEFAAVRDDVEREYKKVQVDQAMNRAAEAIKRELFRSTAGLPAEGPYKSLPPDWSAKMPAMQSLAAVAEAELRKPFPGVVQGTSIGGGPGVWRASPDLARLPAVGFSFFMVGSMRLNFSEYIMQTREFGGAESLAIQKGLVHGPLQDFRGSLYYVRILDTRDAGPPESLAEVRDAAVRNLKMLDAMEKLTAEAETYKERAIADGIDALAGSTGVTPRTNVEVTDEMIKAPMGGMPDSTLDDPDLRKEIMALARRLDPKGQIDAVDRAERTVARTVAKARGLIVAQITGWRPMTIEKFRAGSSEIAGLASREHDAAEILPAFAFERLRERHALKIVDEDRREERKQAQQDEQPAPSGG